MLTGKSEACADSGQMKVDHLSCEIQPASPDHQSTSSTRLPVPAVEDPSKELKSNEIWKERVQAWRLNRMMQRTSAADHSSSTDTRYRRYSSSTVIRRSSSSSRRDRSRRATAPSLPPFVVAPGDIMALVGVVVSTVVTMQAKPTDSWFQPEQNLDHCVPCSGGGETQSCLKSPVCIPYAFLAFEAWSIAWFTISTIYIAKFALRRGRSGTVWAVLIYLFGLFPALGWSLYSGVPWQFRGLVGVIYVVCAVGVLVLYFLHWLVWGRACTPRRSSADV